MSPSTYIITYLAKVEDKVGLVTEQAEDEIAAVNQAFGAAMAGVRSMTATSGGGMALMSETISLAGNAEVPLVIVDCQRPGPATGLPTRTDQSDLLFAIYTGHGEFARAVLAPGNAEQAFYNTARAFNLAETFQIPVIVLAEQYLSDSYYTVDPFDMGKVTRETSMLDDAAAEKLEVYKRYELTEDGVSHRLYPGQSKHLVLTDSHEHDETGHICEEADNRVKMVDKRLKRLGSVVATFDSPERLGNANAETVILGWGTSREPLVESVKSLTDKGLDVGLLCFNDLWPFPTEAAKQAVAHNPRLIAVEGNATAQLTQIFTQHIGRADIRTVLRYDGRPFLSDELTEQLEREVSR
jgi:2-oxoglutarate ferredoxin oxidoreductase subunit alpha